MKIGMTRTVATLVLTLESKSRNFKQKRTFIRCQMRQCRNCVAPHCKEYEKLLYFSKKNSNGGFIPLFALQG